ncbi:hypothetical protein [Escherichia coli IS5]|nr:hypothetical protein [Escherichia coli IS5]
MAQGLNSNAQNEAIYVSLLLCVFMIFLDTLCFLLRLFLI